MNTSLSAGEKICFWLAAAEIDQKYFKQNRLVGSVVYARGYQCCRSGFNFRAGQIAYSVANGSPPLQRFFGAVSPRRSVAEMGSPLVTRFGLIPRV